MPDIHAEPERADHPVDLVEQVASLREWSFDRPGDDEIAIVVKGRGADYAVSFTWMEDLEALHLACAFDIKVPDRRRAEIATLIGMINEQLWIGHFDVWASESLVMFRHSTLLAGGAEMSSRQCEALVEIAVEACEQYLPAFQFLIWAGKSPKQALEAALFDTQGEA